MRDGNIGLVRDWLRILVFVIAVLASAGCATFAVATFDNPHDDVTRAWTLVVASACGVVAVAGWTGFYLLRPKYPWVPDEDAGQ